MIAKAMIYCCAAWEFRRQAGRGPRPDPAINGVWQASSAIQSLLSRGTGADRAESDPWKTALQPRKTYAAGAGGLKSGKRLINAAFKNLKWAIVVASS